MEKIEKLYKEYISENRFKGLIGILIHSIISVLGSILFQKMNLDFVGVAFSTVVSFIFLLKVYDYTSLVVQDKLMGVKDLLFPIKISKKVIIIALSYVLWALVSIVSFNYLAVIENIVPIVFVILVLVFMLGNAVNHTFYFMSDDYSVSSYISSIKFVFQHYKFFFKSVIRGILVFLQGGILIVLMNVFVFSMQISEILKLSEAESKVILNKLFFENDLSIIIQSVGVMVIVYYILFTTSIMYATYIRKQRLNK